MSDANGPTGNPYGEQPNPTGPPPPPPNPYDPGSGTQSPGAPQPPTQPFGQAGQPGPYGDPNPAPANPYGGQQPSYTQQYGQPQQPAYGGGYGQPAYGQPQRDPSKRPGTVTAASIVTLVTSGLSLVGFVILAIGLVVARQDFLDEIRSSRDFQDSGVSADSAYGVVIAIVIGLAVWCLVACLLAIFVMRRSNVARILLVISSAVTLLLSLLLITSLVSGVTLLAALATIVLLFVGGANEWFRAKGQPPAQIPGMTQY